MRYRKLPVEIEAIQWDGENRGEVIDFLMNEPVEPVQAGTFSFIDDHVRLITLEGAMMAKPGTWIIRGIEGEYYPVADSIFGKTYEPINPANRGVGS